MDEVLGPDISRLRTAVCGFADVEALADEVAVLADSESRWPGRLMFSYHDDGVARK